MKAIVQTVYGSPDVLQLAEVQRPIVPANGVLIKVHATSVNAGDWHLMRGTPFLVRLIFGGLLKPKITTLGSDVAGIVEVVGPDVKQFQPGDAVFGDISDVGCGGFAEYVCAPESALAHKPTNLSFELAATVPVAALSALQALRDYGQIRSGQKVLINGASGGVGSFAVQIAKAYGAEVTAVSSTSKIDRLRSIGADHTIDYTQTDITQTGQQFDLILDAAAYRPVFDYLPSLTRNGTYVLIGGSTTRLFQTMFLGPWLTKTRSQNVKVLMVKPNQTDLITLKEMLEMGKIKPMLDRTYPLSEVPKAIHQLEQRQVTGKIAILVE